MEGWKGRLRMCWSGRLGLDDGRIGGIFSFLFDLAVLQLVDGSLRCDFAVRSKGASMGVPVDDGIWAGFLVL